MQDSWCGDDMPLTGSRQTSWEEEEDVEIGMWNSSSSQEANPSLNWPPYMKKMPTKVILVCEMSDPNIRMQVVHGKEKNQNNPKKVVTFLSTTTFLFCKIIPRGG